MRVLYVNHTAAMGGAELCLLETIRGQASEPRVLLFADGPLRLRLGVLYVPTHVVPGGALGEVRRATGVAPHRLLPALAGAAHAVWVDARGVDVIYANTAKALLASVPAGLARRVPVVWHLHDLLTPEHFSAANRRAAVLASRGASAVVANSRATAEAFVAAGGQADKVVVAYNAIDALPFLRLRSGVRARMRAALRLPAEAWIVGVFGRLSPWKGQHVAIEALADLPGAHLLVVGEALFGEDAYARDLRTLAVARGVGERVHFVGFREDVPALLAAVDAVAHTSISPEPFGRVLVEAMAAGRPLVAADAGGAREIVLDGVSGLLTRPGDAAALAQALAGLRADPARAERLAEAGRERALTTFSAERQAATITGLLARLARPASQEVPA